MDDRQVELSRHQDNTLADKELDASPDGHDPAVVCRRNPPGRRPTPVVGVGPHPGRRPASRSTDDVAAEVLQEYPDRVRWKECVESGMARAVGPTESVSYRSGSIGVKCGRNLPSGEENRRGERTGALPESVSFPETSSAEPRRGGKLSPAPSTLRVTAFSVCDILEPGKFGGRCERAARPCSGGASAHDIWSPWMQRLELQLRAEAACSVNSINFLRRIGKSVIFAIVIHTYISVGLPRILQWRGSRAGGGRGSGTEVP